MYRAAIKLYQEYIPYSLDQTPRLLFISSPEFVRRLLTPVAVREVILRETVDWHHWTRRFWHLCWCRKRLELVLEDYLLLFLRASPRAVCFSDSRRGATTIRERQLFHLALPEVQRLFESGVWSSKYGTLDYTWYALTLVRGFPSINVHCVLYKRLKFGRLCLCNLAR